MQENNSRVRFVWIHLKVSQQSKRVSLLVAKLDLNYKIQNDLPWKLKAGDNYKIETLYATSKMADSTANWKPGFSVDHVTMTQLS